MAASKGHVSQAMANVTAMYKGLGLDAYLGTSSSSGAAPRYTSPDKPKRVPYFHELTPGTPYGESSNVKRPKS